MSLQHAAKHLAAHGRGPDTELIHMTKGEIASLQELARANGGSLTVNPHTGLQEAGFLSSILPMAVGAGLMMIPGMQPLGAAAITGGLQYARTGSLSKGLMAGLGAYGGGQLAEGLAGVGTSEAGANLSQANEAAAAKMGADSSARDILMARNSAPAMAMAETPTQTGLSSLVSDPTAEKFKALGGGSWSGLAKNVGMAAAPMIGEAVTPKPYTPPTQVSGADMGPRYSYSPGTATPQPTASATGVEQNYFPGQSYTQLSQADAKALYGFADGGDVQYPPGESVMRMARGGISDHYNLGDYSDGGRLLRGPGDGVSDSIPATIGNKRPARLADGEFVVPARIVSELGNGSTEAGARKLYGMMDRVQSARGKTVGKGRVAKNTRADKYLPA